ncbi:MAG: peptide deformylase [Chitinophagaceae bacterium]|nr:peptide deformylase [Chitinophagaceae bacterium]
MASRKVMVFDSSLVNLEAKMRREVERNMALGLAAPQVGVNLAAALVPLEDGLTFVVNPEIVSRSHRTLSIESCLSIPGREFLVVRHQDLYLTYQTITGEFRDIAFSKNFDQVRVIEHEIDHLLGILIDDFGLSDKHTQDNYYRNRLNNLTFEQTRTLVAERPRLTVSDKELEEFSKKHKLFYR